MIYRFTAKKFVKMLPVKKNLYLGQTRPVFNLFLAFKYNTEKIEYLAGLELRGQAC